MLGFCGKHGIVSNIAPIDIQNINAAYRRMLRSDMSCRFVIDLASLRHPARTLACQPPLKSKADLRLRKDEDFIPPASLLSACMPSSDPMTVSLTPELRRFIEAQVVTGRYQTASEVVRAGLRLLTQADPPRAIDASGVAVLASSVRA